MTHLYLIRHGQTDWNLEGRWQGQSDVPLNKTGRKQAEQIATSLINAELDAIYSSDLIRAADTAAALAHKTGLDIHYDKRLREIHQGDWQGLLVGDIQARYGDAFQRRKLDPLNVAPPGGETVRQVQNRVTAAVEDILAKHPDGRVAIVSHGFSLAVIQVHYLILPMEKVWEMIPENDEWRELVINR
jgi:broad specificity phosphatase PhoE